MTAFQRLAPSSCVYEMSALPHFLLLFDVFDFMILRIFYPIKTLIDKGLMFQYFSVNKNFNKIPFQITEDMQIGLFGKCGFLVRDKLLAEW